MAATIIWTITQLEHLTENGFVTTAHWTATAVDGEHSASVYNTCNWFDNNPVASYDQLTQDVVLNWVWENIDKSAVEATLNNQIELKKNPVSSVGVPWTTP